MGTCWSNLDILAVYPFPKMASEIFLLLDMSTYKNLYKRHILRRERNVYVWGRHNTQNVNINVEPVGKCKIILQEILRHVKYMN